MSKCVFQTPLDYMVVKSSQYISVFFQAVSLSLRGTIPPENIVPYIGNKLKFGSGVRIKGFTEGMKEIQNTPAVGSKLKDTQSSLGDQVNLLEQRVGANEDNVQECVARVKQLEKDNSFLMSKVDDLENRSRRSNLLFVGIQESAEGNDIIGFMSRLIPQLLGPDAFPTLPIIERAHRSPTARQNSRASPRAIMIEPS
ncbi:Hepatoma-derived growth factor [Dissostichus eleginoides]|uniref:Hepatoma-derived growth factor n=1 Tax=Dissostichus eleginoides TaxID=100907 RepID=A0AAD9BY11_DISEL|nr:Hepatoma-derived growth factor [Dissostichus eleginoides]